MAKTTSTALAAAQQQLSLFDGVETRLERKRRMRRESQHRYRLKHPEKVRARDKAYADKNRGKRRAYCREYQVKNREVLREKRKNYAAKIKQSRKVYYRVYSKKKSGMISAQKKAWAVRNASRVKSTHTRYYIQNSDAAKRRAVEWREKNPERARSLGLHRVRLRQSKKLAAQVGDPADIRAFYLYVRSAEAIHCHYCNKLVPKGRREIDHVTPLSRDGPHCVTNLVAACGPCNKSKNAKTAEEFADWLKLKATLKGRTTAPVKSKAITGAVASDPYETVPK